MSENSWVFLLVLISLAIVGSVLFAYFLNWKISNSPYSVSPYTKQPLRPLADTSYYFKEQVIRYMLTYNQYDNQPFAIAKASYCRETGRIFPNSITWYGAIRVDWHFLSKRCPGNYVSWGSLTREAKREVFEKHTPLIGYQTEESSPRASPSLIEPEYAFTTPGPLYVDMTTKVLIGWKCVPNTSLEVLIVQHPVK